MSINFGANLAQNPSPIQARAAHRAAALSLAVKKRLTPASVRFYKRAGEKYMWMRRIAAGHLALAQIVCAVTPALFCSLPAAAQNRPSKVTVGYAGLGGVMISTWVTKEGGYLEKNGLAADFIYIASSSKAIQAMLAGDIHFLTSNSSSVVQANQGGADLVIIAGQVNRMVNSIISLPEIKEFSDLKGKTLGVTRFGSYTDFEARYALNHFGLKAGKDVALLQIGGQAELFAGLMTRKIHSGVISPPFLQKALEKGMNELLDIRKISPQYPANVMVTRRKFVETNYDATRKFVKAYLEGIHRTRTDKEFTVKVISKYTREKDSKILSDTYDYYSKDAFDRVPYVTDEGMKMVFEQMSDTIPGWKDLKSSSFVDMRILKELDGSGFVQQLYGSK
jgi:NitT/TauT family transport system substrate-binding protein